MTALIEVPPTNPTRRAGITRRTFLAGTGAAAGAAAAAVALGPQLAFASPTSPSDGDVIVLIFLRGGADGLSLVAPWQMPTYRTLRPTIRVKGPDEVAAPNAGLPLTAGGSVAPFDLDGVFALHPGLAPLHAGPWAAGDLAVVHAVGMPAAESDTRSHFESMRNWEAGSASLYVNTGFLNRFLGAVGATEGIPAIGRGATLARSLDGPVPTFSMNDLNAFGIHGFGDNTKVGDALARWYRPSESDVVAQVGANTLAAIDDVAGVSWTSAAYAPQNGAVYGTDDIARNLADVAKVIRAGLGLRVACIDAGGWDTHEGMGAPDDPNSDFRRRSANLAGALAAFWRDLGPAMSGVTVVTVSEFGRTINENGTGGTDHGRGTAMFVMGGGVAGGVYGDFVPTIEDGPEGDLAVKNDFRRVLGEVLTVRGGAADAHDIFPTWEPQAPLGLCTA